MIIKYLLPLTKFEFYSFALINAMPFFGPKFTHFEPKFLEGTKFTLFGPIYLINPVINKQ